jgi:hypothetical protein
MVAQQCKVLLFGGMAHRQDPAASLIQLLRFIAAITTRPTHNACQSTKHADNCLARICRQDLSIFYAAVNNTGLNSTAWFGGPNFQGILFIPTDDAFRNL